MASLESHVRDCAKLLEPTKKQKDGAKRSNNFLRDVLCTGNFKNRVNKSYLSGSYSRETAISPLDDVDIIFLINPKHKDWKRSIFSDYPDPNDLLKSFARAVRYRYPESSVRVQRRSIRLRMNHLNIDVVPAVNLDNSGNYIMVPDRKDNKWIKSGPKIHSLNAANINKKQSGRFIPLVKLLKHWNSQLPSTSKLKSFAIETMAARIFRIVKFNSLDEGLILYFDYINSIANDDTLFQWKADTGITASRLSGLIIPDLAETGSNVSTKVNFEKLKKLSIHATKAKKKIKEASEAKNDKVAIKRIKSGLRIKN